MGSSDRLLNRQRTLHQILGGGLVADVILWRSKDLTLNILIFTVAAWMVFELSGYTLLSFISNVLLLLFTILFLWAKSSAILNRPSPPLPHLHITEEMTSGMASFLQDCINDVLFEFEQISMGRDTRKFIQLTITLLVISILGNLYDFATLFYTCIFVVLTAPALYELYQDNVDNYAVNGYKKLMQFYKRFHDVCVKKAAEWSSDKKSS